MRVSVANTSTTTQYPIIMGQGMPCCCFTTKKRKKKNKNCEETKKNRAPIPLQWSDVKSENENKSWWYRSDKQRLKIRQNIMGFWSFLLFFFFRSSHRSHYLLHFHSVSLKHSSAYVTLIPIGFWAGLSIRHHCSISWLINCCLREKATTERRHLWKGNVRS